jgi:hypothetical protein
MSGLKSPPSSALIAAGFMGALLFVIYFGNFIDLLFITTFNESMPGKILKNVYLTGPLFLMLGWLYRGRATVTASDKRLYVYLLLVMVLTVTRLPPLRATTLDNLQILLLFPLLYFIGRGLAVFFGDNAGETLMRAHVLLLMPIFVFGICEAYLIPHFWAHFDLFGYYETKVSRDFWVPSYGVPRSWLSWDLVKYGLGGMRRMVSVIMEPVGIGRVMAIGAVFVLFFPEVFKVKPWVRYWLGAAFIAGGLMAVSKSFVFVVGFFALATKFGLKIVVGGMVALIALLYGLVVLGLGRYVGPSALNHFSSVYYALTAVMKRPWGGGVGIDYVKNVFDVMGGEGTSLLAVRSEGAVMVFILLFGWLGLLIYGMLFWSFLPVLERQDETIRKVGMLALVVLCSSVFARSAFSAVGSGVVFMVLGAKVAQDDRGDTIGRAKDFVLG